MLSDLRLLLLLSPPLQVLADKAVPGSYERGKSPALSYLAAYAFTVHLQVAGQLVCGMMLGVLSVEDQGVLRYLVWGGRRCSAHAGSGGPARCTGFQGGRSGALLFPLTAAAWVRWKLDAGGNATHPVCCTGGIASRACFMSRDLACYPNGHKIKREWQLVYSC